MSADLKQPVIALVGPPNAGKTTLFNALTGAGGQPVNYPGATVEYTLGTARRQFGLDVQIVDTPGTYSLSPKSPDERVTHDILLGTGPTRPAAVIAVVDGTQLSRHLPLVRQLQETGYPIVVAVTMKDLLERDGLELQTEVLRTSLNLPVFALSGRDLKATASLLSAAARAAQAPSAVRTPAGWSAHRQEQELIWSGAIAQKVLSRSDAPRARASNAERTRRIDRFLLHPVFGLVLFLCIMSALFTSIFWLAAPAMEAVTWAFETLAETILAMFPHQLWADFLAGGFVLSLGAILTFVPQIVVLFLGISLLEDSGYLARAATLIDKPLTYLGLNGRSFVPLLSGYACAIPAMLAARTIPNRKERWLTLFIIPLMSCSARLPVYSLLLAFLFWGEPAWKPGLALAVIYLLSLLVGSLAAALANRWIRADDPSFFLMELPFYRRPNPGPVLKTVWLRTESYIRKAGPPIFVFAVALWAATTFPHYDAPTPSEKLNTSFAAAGGRLLDPVMQPMGGDWRTGIALISAFAAREVFVASLGLVLQVSEQDERAQEISLLATMRETKRANGTPLFTTASTVGLILFFMIALQCMATVAVARREFGNWRMPIIQLVAFNLVAYLIAVGVVQALHAFGIA